MSENTFKMLHNHLYNVACCYWALFFTVFCLRKIVNICTESINGNLHPKAIVVWFWSESSVCRASRVPIIVSSCIWYRRWENLSGQGNSQITALPLLITSYFSVKNFLPLFHFSLVWFSFLEPSLLPCWPKKGSNMWLVCI